MLRYTFSGTEVLLGLGGLCLLLTLAVYLFRRHLGHTGESAAAANIFGYTPTIHRLSLCASVFTVFLAINWTDGAELPTYESGPVMVDEIIEVVPRMTDRPKQTPPPPPPPPLVIEPVLEEVPTVDLSTRAVTLEDVVAAPAAPVRRSTTAAPPPPPPPADTAAVIFAERMPVFGEACRKLTGDERKSCSDRALLAFVQQQVSYPPLARGNGIEGTVVVRFVVERDGTVSSIESLRGVGGGCTQAAIRAVAEINRVGERFSPGIQAGQRVRVAFTLPIKFTLTN
ncbi:energy transducer TonB [Lewinella sp. JB7]|uniref:energy transducer TonB n=1 Tax=Lewinella sp. JB7 TaxID=2962887 RepID=UPI0020CA206C|nr:energy transducer TonB [Lewinella sp. JB7]MCP9236403.1 TonB family protein [Lewinella sp. JB7]